MKSPEQMGRPLKQPEEEPMRNKKKTPEKSENVEPAESKNKVRELERKITTPEEAAEMTRQRREDFGLGEARELKPEESAEIEKSIEEFLAELDKYDFKSYSPEVQEKWYWAELEATAGKDRELAKTNLEKLLKVLQEEAEKTEK